MKTKVISTMLMVFLLGAFSAMAMAQGKKGMQHDHMTMDMAKEPHHVLAMAYHQNLASFAKTLHEQTMQTGSVNVEFAQSAVAEMRRSFDQMSQHHQEHMQKMSAEEHTKMSAMMQQMDTHHTELNTDLTALEQEVKASNPDAKKVTTLAVSISSHLAAMAKMHQGSKMKV